MTVDDGIDDSEAIPSAKTIAAAAAAGPNPAKSLDPLGVGGTDDHDGDGVEEEDDRRSDAARGRAVKRNRLLNKELALQRAGWSVQRGRRGGGRRLRRQ